VARLLFGVRLSIKQRLLALELAEHLLELAGDEVLDLVGELSNLLGKLVTLRGELVAGDLGLGLDLLEHGGAVGSSVATFSTMEV